MNCCCWLWDKGAGDHLVESTVLGLGLGAFIPFGIMPGRVKLDGIEVGELLRVPLNDVVDGAIPVDFLLLSRTLGLMGVLQVATGFTGCTIGVGSPSLIPSRLSQ